MAPQIPALAKSESKIRFFERLRLDQQHPQHLRVYRAMKAEAAQGRKRIVEEHGLENVSEIVMRNEILRTYRLASPETRVIYDLGRDTDGDEEDNWIVRWMLWHVFRYRDERNNKGRKSALSDDEGPDIGSSARASSSSTAAPARPQQRQQQQQQQQPYWDPVRSSWRRP